ncbi:hypothetical protein ONR57_09910 [Hoyosella sp. YIM 151337]|uniref:hypothetical protein n=1 Tax=Hoyosella sp. YIM 151337 TaxID=2992742 RepID=UPI002235E42B|nr:hypothetical protein [Hoyosella sp. YIM 151337]MCW4353608.1 hypothetical protein [Hoyosella sp. YIM 151337]
MRIGGLLVTIALIWLIVGAIAAGQRGLYTDTPPDCPGVSTLVVTIIAGPLNYFGVNPEVAECQLPEPSQ